MSNYFDTDNKTDNLIEKCILDINEEIKALSDNNDKILISSKDFTKPFENFVIKTIVNRNIDVVSKRSIKNDSFDKKIHLKETEKCNNNKYDSGKLVKKNRILEEKRSLKSVVASTHRSDSLDSLKSPNKSKTHRDDLYSRNKKNEIMYNKKKIIEDTNQTNFKYNNSYDKYSGYDRPIRNYEGLFNNGRKRTIGSLMEKYDDEKHRDKYKSDFKHEYKSDKHFYYDTSESKCLSSNEKSKDKGSSELLNKLKSRFEDHLVDNDNYSEKAVYVKKSKKIPLYSEHDDRFYKDDSFKKPVDFYIHDASSYYKPNIPYQNFSKYYYYDSNPDICSYYNSGAYYQPRYQLSHHPYGETYQHKAPKINNANAIYGGIADFQDAFNNRVEPKVKSEPGEHITYNKDYTSISLKYDETFDSKDDSTSNSEDDKRKISKKKKSKKSKKSKKKKKHKRRNSTDLSDSSNSSYLSSDFDLKVEDFKPMLAKQMEKIPKKIEEEKELSNESKMKNEEIKKMDEERRAKDRLMSKVRNKFKISKPKQPIIHSNDSEKPTKKLDKDIYDKNVDYSYLYDGAFPNDSIQNESALINLQNIQSDSIKDIGEQRFEETNLDFCLSIILDIISSINIEKEELTAPDKEYNNEQINSNSIFEANLFDKNSTENYCSINNLATKKDEPLLDNLPLIVSNLSLKSSALLSPKVLQDKIVINDTLNHLECITINTMKKFDTEAFEPEKTKSISNENKFVSNFTEDSTPKSIHEDLVSNELEFRDRETVVIKKTDSNCRINTYHSNDKLTYKEIFNKRDKMDFSEEILPTISTLFNNQGDNFDISSSDLKNSDLYLDKTNVPLENNIYLDSNNENMESNSGLIIGMAAIKPITDCKNRIKLKISDISSAFISSGELYKCSIDGEKDIIDEENKITNEKIQSSSESSDNDHKQEKSLQKNDLFKVPHSLREKKKRKHKEKHNSKDRHKYKDKIKREWLKRLKARSHSRSFSVSKAFDEKNGVWRDHLKQTKSLKNPLFQNLDKMKLREIAIKNAFLNMKKGYGPIYKFKASELAEMRIAGGGGGAKTVTDYTDICKMISYTNHASNLEDMSDSELSVLQNLSDDEDKVGFTNIPIKPSQIVLNIRDAKQLPALSAQEKMSKTAALRVMFPVSTGAQHRQNSNEWKIIDKEKELVYPEIIISKSQDENQLILEDKYSQPILDISANAYATPSLDKNTAVQMMQNNMLIDNAPHMQVDDIASIKADRLDALRRLQENDNDKKAEDLYYSQMKMQYWSEQNNVPGQFFYSLSHMGVNTEKLKTSNWLRKTQPAIKVDLNKYATSDSCNLGKLMLLRMGWSEGKGLGKHNEGIVNPLQVKMKNDKRGLLCKEDKKPRHLAFSRKDVHPVSLLTNLSTANGWGYPYYEMVEESGPDHMKYFLMKVIVNGVEYQPSSGSSNKKAARTEAAIACLNSLGIEI